MTSFSNATILEITRSRLPRHVAIIMDGNGRWAQARGLPRTAGHKKGAEAARRTIEAAAEMGIDALTLFAFSSENWSRPETEISDLMGLLKYYLKHELNTLLKNDVRFRVLGDVSKFAPDIQKLLKESEEKTFNNKGLCLNIALNYGGRADITHAVRQLAAQVAGGLIEPEDIDESTVGRHLMSAGLPDPDLMIRTSGEQRISNFLLWQAAYAELWFTDKLWPDFDRTDLEAACADYIHRDRRFGDVKTAKIAV